MSGDPVEESSQAMRNGFVQALQTSHTTAALMRGRGGEARSKAESEQRMRHAAGKERRSFIEHRLRVIDAVESAGQVRELNTAKVDEVRSRIERGGELHELEQQQKNRQMERADADLDRRDKAGKLERKHTIKIHKLQVDGYTNREARAVELHELDVEYKKLLIDIRRRAAGFSDTLTVHGESGETMASAAAFAAAKGSEGLSEQHDRDVDAYAERFVEDTGTDYTEVLDATVVGDFGDFDDLDAGVGEQARSSVAMEDIVGLTEELSFATHLAHEFADFSEEADAEPDEGAAIGEVVDAAGLSGDGLTEAMDFAVDPGPPSVPVPPVPDPGIEP
ncbi:hypothetical protein OH799_11880 [Nocardia sp. NBC_00881]|uniref:hypothetical protein n=1 Tax=Nocardia sp. NBC_00881 TaxID=2975995 RepID=UPI00386F136D|nr:hypothetical protein OH799_11880 [Nocardia sp. NBC_00881]